MHGSSLSGDSAAALQAFAEGLTRQRLAVAAQGSPIFSSGTGRKRNTHRQRPQSSSAGKPGYFGLAASRKCLRRGARHLYGFSMVGEDVR
jgi:hypothetical protein